MAARAQITKTIPSIITQRALGQKKAVCFDLNNTLIRFTSTPGKSFLSRMQTAIQKQVQHGTKIAAICNHLESPEVERQVSAQFYAAAHDVGKHWKEFGVRDNVDLKLWWKNVAYNALHREGFIQDSRDALRQKTDKLTLIEPTDYAQTDSILVNVNDALFPSNRMEFKFDAFFDELYSDWSSAHSYRLFPDARTFINFLRSYKYYEHVVVGLATHDSFGFLDDMLKALRLQYFDFVVTPQSARCSKHDQKFYHVAKAEIMESIKRRMIEVESMKLYGVYHGKDSPVYDRKTRMDIVSQWGEEHALLYQEKEIKAAYDEHFERIVDADEVDCIMVGNSIKKDILPTLELGWRACWLLRSSRFPDVEQVPLEEYERQLNEAGIAHFGQTKWDNDVKQRALVVKNLFDIHHHGFLW